MQYLIILEQTEAGFSVQVPDLAIVTYGKNIDDAKDAAIAAIKINLEGIFFKFPGKLIELYFWV